MKTKKHIIVFTCLLLIVSTCFSETQSIRDFDIKTIEKLGNEIYLRDKYAAQATDIVFEKVGGPDKLAEKKVKGWIINKLKGKYLVRFIKQTKDELLPAYDIVFTSSGKNAFREATGELTAQELAKFNARQLALESIPEPSSDRYNTVVLPNVGGKGFLAYTLAATTDPDLIYIGGHYRMTISENGKKVERIDRLFKSCLILNKGDVPEGAESAALFASHVVSNTPVETHVFVSLLHDQSLYIATGDKMWSIENGKIRTVRK